MREYFFPVIKLSQILRRITECIVDGLVSTDGKNYVRSASCHYGIQHSRGIYYLDIDLDACIGCEGIIDHGLQDGTLITSCQNPYLNDLLIGILIIYIADRIVVYEE